jgi:hypothetical protein
MDAGAAGLTLQSSGMLGESINAKYSPYIWSLAVKQTVASD